MGKIKGWKKVKDTKTGIRWRNLFIDEAVHVVYDYNIPFGRNDKTYYYMVKDSSSILRIKKGLTKTQAKDLAIRYMKTHPNG